MSILLWLVTIGAYIGLHFYLRLNFSITNMWLAVAALVLGFISFATGKRLWLLGSFGVLFMGIVFLYTTFLTRGLIVWWIAALAVVIFMAVLASLREQ